MKLGFVVVYVEDVKSTLSFYQEAFGLKIRMSHEEGGVILYGELETDGAVLAFASYEMGEVNLGGRYQKISRDGDPFGQEIVFVEEDVQSVFSRAIEHGAISIVEPNEKPWGQTVAFVRSIEGTLIEICSPMQAP